ncbi:hypothetical protein EJ03DRAFT_354577 [Teratosphaeria nubilosa]|uniref:Uncharacterized protein n=1 Tax=Teratosphaeria nubilosa TaxID=161662 RepID=A0A6G1KZN6_9PEZI|nr:hypothetical protein EJ03DRAFT_354577 [Teratosphaeria nubilosa]
MSRPSTQPTTSSTPTGRSRLWTFHRVASLQYLYDFGRTKHGLINDQVATIWNRLHDVTAERSGPVEWKTLRTQMTEVERVDKKISQAWQEIKLVIKAIKLFKKEENGETEREEGGEKQDKDVPTEDASGSLSDGEEIRVPVPWVVADESDDEEGDTISVAIHPPRNNSAQQVEARRADEAASEVEQAGIADHPQHLNAANINAIQHKTNEIPPDSSDLGDPFGLLDNISVSANDHLLPPSAESEASEALRRAVELYGPTEEDTDMPDADGE